MFILLYARHGEKQSHDFILHFFKNKKLHTLWNTIHT